jgi:hypothetical protein
MNKKNPELDEEIDRMNLLLHLVGSTEIFKSDLLVIKNSAKIFLDRAVILHIHFSL